VHIKSADPLALPEFDCGFLSHPSDMPIHVWTYKKSREIARRLPCFMGEVPSKHPKFPPHSNAVCKLNAIRKTAKFGFNKAGEVTEVKKPDPKQIPDIVYSAEDDQLIEDWVRTNVTNVFHSASTCAMKPRADGGVVDRFLNVYGVKGLKVRAVLLACDCVDPL
jgi:alcohol oxidase